MFLVRMYILKKVLVTSHCMSYREITIYETIHKRLL